MRPSVPAMPDRPVAAASPPSAAGVDRLTSASAATTTRGRRTWELRLPGSVMVELLPGAPVGDGRRLGRDDAVQVRPVLADGEQLGCAVGTELVAGQHEVGAVGRVRR